MNAELKQVLCKLSLRCGMKPDRKVVPKFICFWARWGPTGRSLSTLLQQMWTEISYLLLPTSSPSHPTPLAGMSIYPEKAFSLGWKYQATSRPAARLPWTFPAPQVWGGIAGAGGGYRTPMNSASSADWAVVRGGRGSLHSVDGKSDVHTAVKMCYQNF